MKLLKRILRISNKLIHSSL